ncbi:MAG: hypothetical protein FJX75_22295 [Armatimonadetes bacterium]|nr:hypothetical protein [Armatimonadota bacterium]
MPRVLRRECATLVLLCVVGLPTSSASDRTSAPPKPDGCPDGVVEQPLLDPVNGITVSEPKLLDERSLLEKLQNLRMKLASLNALDQTTLTGQLGTLQGLEAGYSQFSLQTNLLSPQVSRPTDVKKETVSGYPETPPEPVEAPTPTSTSPKVPEEFKIGARNMLAEQLQIMYEIINTQTLLEMTLSDRVFEKTRGDYKPRLRAVLGFPICVEPKYKKAVAEIEIDLRTIDADGGQKEPASVVFLMPDERTYNVSTFSSRSAGFGLGAALQLWAPGISGGSTRQALYLVRDRDVVAFVRPPGTFGVHFARFGWQFRPVLGRKTVDYIPNRLMLASLALPAGSQQEGYQFSARIYTRWRRYESRTRIVGDAIPGSDRMYRFDSSTRQIPVWTPEEVEKRVGPRVYDITVRDVGEGSVIVDVLGQNFLPNTVVRLGRTTYTTDTLFVRHSEQRLRFVADALSLLRYEPLVIGPYGEPQSLQDLSREEREEGEEADELVLQRDQCSLTARTASEVHVQLVFKGKGSCCTPEALGAFWRTGGVEEGTTSELQALGAFWLPSVLEDTEAERHTVEPFTDGLGATYLTDERPPSEARFQAPYVVLIGEEVFGLGDSPIRRTAYKVDGKVKRVEFDFDVKSELLRQNDRLYVQKLMRPLKQGESWQHKFSDFNVTRLVRLGVWGLTARVGLEGTGLDDTVTVCIGDRTYHRDGPQKYVAPAYPTLLSFDVDVETLRTAQCVTATKGNLPPVVLSLSGEAAPLPTGTPTINPQTQPVVEDQETNLVLTGKNLSSIKAIRYGASLLTFICDAAGSSLTLTVKGDVAADPGQRELVCELLDGGTFKFSITVSAKPTPTPTIAEPATLITLANGEKEIRLTGAALTATKSITAAIGGADKTPVRFQAAPDGSSATLWFGADVTITQGRYTLKVTTTGEQTLVVTVEITGK